VIGRAAHAVLGDRRGKWRSVIEGGASQGLPVPPGVPGVGEQLNHPKRVMTLTSLDRMVMATLSAADATAHVLQNPFVPDFLEGQAAPVTLVLIALLGGIFLRGFGEAIGIAVGVVAVYLALNLIVVTVALMHVLGNPDVVADWRNLLVTKYPSPLAMVGGGVHRLPEAGPWPLGL